MMAFAVWVGCAWAATAPQVGLVVDTTADRDVLQDADGQVVAEDTQAHVVARLELGAVHRFDRPVSVHGRVGVPLFGVPAPWAVAGGGTYTVWTGRVDVGVGGELAVQHTRGDPWRRVLVPAATVSVDRGAWSVVARPGWAVPLSSTSGPAGPSWERVRSGHPGPRVLNLAVQWRPGRSA